MDTSDSPNTACIVCSKSASSFCTGCADGRDATGNYLTPTRYCGTDCQKSDWSSHRTSCQAAQPTIKLFRTGQLLQECFLATRAEAFDLCVIRVERIEDGTIHFFDKPAERIRPLSPTLNSFPEAKNAVLCYGAGHDAFSGLMFELGKQAFKGYTARVEEMDVRMFNSRILTHRHHANDPSTAVSNNVHHILRVTLKDKSVWAVDVAGSQHAQYHSVVPFADYARGSIAKILDTRPFGTNARNTHLPVLARNPGNMVLAMQLEENQSHQCDELAEWEHHHVTVPQLLKAKREDYLLLKTELVGHLATQAREYVKLSQGDSSSTAKLILVKNHGLESMSDEDKGRMERKKARRLASMDVETRRQWEEEEAKGTGFVML